jgi:MFS family permease
MNVIPLQLQWLNKWLVFGAVSLAFFFLNLSTFTSLGVVLYTMVAELHWSMTAAGFSFTLLGLACGLSSPLPALTLRWLGSRATVCMGATLLFLGFFLASVSHSLLSFYVAMVLLGSGYSLAGNVPAIALIAGWFTCGSARTIGLYLMLGALGAAFGPPIVEAIVSGSGGWRGYWQVMAFMAAGIGVVCLLFVRDAHPAPESLPEVCPETCVDVQGCEIACSKKHVEATVVWTSRQAIFTPQFLLVAASMAATMACVTTNSSTLVSHLVKLGTTSGQAAIMLSVIAITATVVKGVAGRLCEKFPPTYLLGGGLLFQAVGTLAFGFADTAALQYASAIAFGTGWGLSYVAATVVLLEYFGPTTGSRVLSVVWFLTTVAAAGPVAAGMIADRYGTFAPIFIFYAGMLVVLAVPVFLMRGPVRRPAEMVPAKGEFVESR